MAFLEQSNFGWIKGAPMARPQAIIAAFEDAGFSFVARRLMASSERALCL